MQTEEIQKYVPVLESQGIVDEISLCASLAKILVACIDNSNLSNADIWCIADVLDEKLTKIKHLLNESEVKG